MVKRIACSRDSVEMLPCDEALAEHRPDVVLCSWMPLGVDWTSSMRACPQVSLLGLITYHKILLQIDTKQRQLPILE